MNTRVIISCAGSSMRWVFPVIFCAFFLSGNSPRAAKLPEAFPIHYTELTFGDMKLVFPCNTNLHIGFTDSLYRLASAKGKNRSMRQ